MEESCLGTAFDRVCRCVRLSSLKHQPGKADVQDVLCDRQPANATWAPPSATWKIRPVLAQHTLGTVCLGLPTVRSAEAACRPSGERGVKA
jgi:hypothetical protein